MRQFTKLLSLILAILTVIGLFALASCDNGKGGDTDSSKVAEASSDNEGSEAKESYHLRDLSNGKNLNSDGTNKFTVYMRSESEMHYAGLYIIPDEGKTDAINQDAYSRNQLIEEKYNISFAKIEGDPSDTINEDYQSGEYYYDIVLDMRVDLGSYALGGYMMNLNNFDIDYTTDWWDANAAKAYSISNKLFVMPNDVSISNLGGTRFWFFSKQVLSDFKLTSPYEYANNDTWTLETFYTLVKSVSAPSTDGSLGTYGLALEEDVNLYHMLVGAGVPWCELNSAGELICEIGTTYAEKIQDFITDFKKIASNSDYCLSYGDASEADPAGEQAYPDIFTHTRALFNADHFLFIMSNMNSAGEFGETKSGFGVVMNPKTDKNQSEYYHMMDIYSIIWGVVNIPGINTERLAAVMDYWAFVSHSTVMETYYELTLKTKRASDPTAANMLDTIKGSIRYFPTDIYGDCVSSLVRDCYSKSVTSAWKQNKRSLTSTLKEIVASINEIDD